MGSRDPRVDAYIARSADFARPVLTRIRETVHRACPEVEETMKWSFPHFMYHGMLCSMAAFKAHCAFGFWKGRLVLPAGRIAGKDAMGQFGRLTSQADLPSARVLAGYVKRAMALNRERVKSPTRSKPKPRPAIPVPGDLARQLKTHPAARATFEGFPPSHRHEYLEWIEEAKRPETRARRIATTIEWLSEGKSRHWKYQT